MEKERITGKDFLALLENSAQTENPFVENKIVSDLIEGSDQGLISVDKVVTVKNCFFNDKFGLSNFVFGGVLHFNGCRFDNSKQDYTFNKLKAVKNGGVK